MKDLFFLLLIAFGLVSCGQNNVTVDNSLQKVFSDNGIEGTFGIYNNSNGQFTIYNLNRFRDSAYLPASTFKIVNALVGLETGKISDKKMIIKWDGIHRSVPEWSQDLSMEQAFKISAVPYFQEVARQIGKDTLQLWLDSLGYGSRYKKPVIAKIDSFWLDNTVKVTADEQLGLMKKLYFDQLPFQKRTMRVVKEVMVMENGENYSLSYKTGVGFRENGNALGWIIGWIMVGQTPQFFALNCEGPKQVNTKELRMKVLKSILHRSGVLKGDV